MRLLLATIFSVISILAFAQDWEDDEIKLQELFLKTRIDSGTTNIFAIHDTFELAFLETLDQKNSFEYPFRGLTNISIQYPQDSTFRIFSWLVSQRGANTKYFAYLQMDKPNSKVLPIATAADIDNPDIEFENFTLDKGIGGIIYNIHEYKTKRKKEYLIFGFKQLSPYENFKYIDVLYFDDGVPMLGKPVFVKGEESSYHPKEKFRHVMRFISEGSTKLNFDPSLDCILFDHLTPYSHPVSRDNSFIGDGTYEGYKLSKGKWVHVEKMFHEVLDEAPRPKPVLGGKKDILGRN